MSVPNLCPNCRRDVHESLTGGATACPWCHCGLLNEPELPLPKAPFRPRTTVGRVLWATGKALLLTVAIIAGGYALLLGFAFAACSVCH